MHAATDQGTGLALRVQVVGDFPAIDLELHRIDLEVFADIHRHEERHLRVRRKQQLFLEQEKVPVEVENLLLECLDVLVERAKLAPRRGLAGFGRDGPGNRGIRPRRGGILCDQSQRHERQREYGD